MDQPSASKKGSTIDMKALVRPFKQLRFKSKGLKKPAPIAGGVVENSVSGSPSEVASAESSEQIWTVSLLQLPNELLEHVFFLLHPLEVVKCRLLSNHFKQLIDGSIELRLRIDLAIDGYLLGYRGMDPAKDVRDFHEKRRKALEGMKYITSWEEPVSHGDLGHFEVCDGILATLIAEDPTKAIFKTIMYKELIPPQSRVKRWIREWDDLGMLITDFSYWTQGDLQVLMEPRDDNTCRRLHFRTISTNEVHPKSAAPYIDLFKADYPIWEHCNSISYEDRVAYAFWEERGMSRVGAGLVLDSKESKVIMPYIPLSDLSFLSRDEALLLFNGQEGRGVGLGVYSFPLQRVVCECRFPFTDPLNRIAFLTRPESRFGDKCPSSIARTILPDQEVNILAMTFRLGYFSNPACCVLALQLFSNMYKSLLKDHPGREAFEWEEWGPTVTRWLPYQKVMPTGNRSIFGSRMLAWGEPAWLDGSSRFELSLILLDFNPRPIKRGATTNTEGESHEIVVTYETSWDFHPGNHPPLKSSLPFRAFTFPWFPNFPYFRFDGSTILAKGPEKYQFWSFLPLESKEEPEKEEQAENTVS